MTPADRHVVETHLRRLNPPELAAFVADLWDAQGFRTELDGLGVVAKRGEETLIIRVADAVSEPVSADLVVAIGGGFDGHTTTLDAGDLAERLWYAVDRPVARELCRRHLGEVPSELSTPLRLRVQRWWAGRSVPALAWILVVAVVIVFVVGLLASSGWLPNTGGTDSQVTASDPPAATATPAAETAWSHEPRLVDASTVDSAQLPPGVNSDGIDDIDALSSAHSRAIGNQSYTMSIDRYQPEIWAQEVIDIHRDIDVEVSSGTYLLNAAERANGETIPMGTLYYDGTNTYLAQEGFSGVSYRRVPPTELRQRYPPPPSELTERLVSTRLSTPTTEVQGVLREGGDRLYLLTGSGQPEWQDIGDVQRYNVSALVTEAGLVRDVSLSYTIRDGDRLVDVRREVTYDEVGETTVDPPGWYHEQFAGNETGT
ncbi:MAG: hypothetical protein V5A45_01030 [Haloarculaceae archaeon]